jgi:imidazolonepropionase-like amidohydrolase
MSGLMNLIYMLMRYCLMLMHFGYYNGIFIESVARNDVKVIKSKKLYDGIGEKDDYYVGFEDNRLTYIDSEKPLQNDVEMIVEDAVVTPAFIDLHSHIGMVRAGEPADEDECNDHMHPVSPAINALHSIYMDDVSFT